MPQTTCRECERPFFRTSNHQGFANVCPQCFKGQDEERVGGNMVWHHKTAPVLEIKPMAQAQRFSQLSRRFGAGPLKAICQPKEGNVGRESSKHGSGAELGALYHSSLGEKRSIKR